MRRLSLLAAASAAGLAGAALMLADGRLAGSHAEDGRTGIATRISGPHVHENLAIYFVHGTSAPGPVPLTLAEALEKGAVRVLETGQVNALEIENIGAEEVYIQAGDIVKGGKQDRVLTTSLALPPRSGRVAIGSYCVEQGRWAARGKEDVLAFASARDALPSREAKLAMKKPAASPSGPSAVSGGRIPSYSEQRTAGIAQRRTGGDGLDTGSRQGEVWNEVAKTQRKLAAGLTTATVAAPESRSSLQLTLENEKLKAARDGYLAALAEKAKGHGAASDGDIVGFVFAINGKLNSADIYPSGGLFQKMWPKLLNASITEAIGERSAPAATAAMPANEAVVTFLAAAENGKGVEHPVGKLMKQEIRDADQSLYVEARRASGGFVHRNYLAK
jgi:hypothetical protein